MLSRKEALAQLSSETFDVVVIGGGITGAGIALDAASRGIKVHYWKRKIMLRALVASQLSLSMVDYDISNSSTLDS